jgi:peptide/nickel transport system permease protein
MGLWIFLVKRLLWMVPTLLGVSVIMFCLTILIPGDPALLRLGNFATAEQLQQLRTEMGLDKPPHERYWLYLSGVVRGDLGRSWRTGDTVMNDLKARFPTTLELGLYSTILSIVLGIPIGVVTAAHKDSYLDYGGKLYGVLGVAVPLFWLGLILVYVFYYQLGIAPAPTGRIDMLVDPPPSITGLYVVDSVLSVDMEALWSSLSHLVLPVMTLQRYSVGHDTIPGMGKPPVRISTSDRPGCLSNGLL